jgi:hypothetical protein
MVDVVLDRPVAEAVIERARRRQRRRRWTMAACLLALVAATLVAGVRAIWPGNGSAPLSTFAEQSASISVRYPSGWEVSTVPFTPVSDPIQRFVLYSPAPLPSALAPRPGQVIAQLSKAVPPLATDFAAFPARPQRFRMPALGRMEGFDGTRWGEITFRDHGRGFYLFIGIGANARNKEQALLRALDSLTIRAR